MEFPTGSFPETCYESKEEFVECLILIRFEIFRLNSWIPSFTEMTDIEKFKRDRYNLHLDKQKHQ